MRCTEGVIVAWAYEMDRKRARERILVFCSVWILVTPSKALVPKCVNLVLLLLSLYLSHTLVCFSFFFVSLFLFIWHHFCVSRAYSICVHKEVSPGFCTRKSEQVNASVDITCLQVLSLKISERILAQLLPKR